MLQQDPYNITNRAIDGILPVRILHCSHACHIVETALATESYSRRLGLLLAIAYILAFPACQMDRVFPGTSNRYSSYYEIITIGDLSWSDFNYCLIGDYLHIGLVPFQAFKL